MILEAQRFWSDALIDETRAVVDYNVALAGFEFAKGTIMDYDKVVIGEGPLPHCVEIRAVEHEQERSKPGIARRAAHAHPPCNYAEGSVGLPQLPAGQPVPLPALLTNGECSFSEPRLPGSGATTPAH